MAEIRVDLKELRRINYRMPSGISGLDGVRRELGLLRWRIPEAVRKETDMDADLQRITQKLEQEITRIKNVSNTIETAIELYMNIDRNLTADLEQFQ